MIETRREALCRFALVKCQCAAAGDKENGQRALERARTLDDRSLILWANHMDTAQEHGWPPKHQAVYFLRTVK